MNDNGEITKVIAHAGIASRRKAEAYITDGRVKVKWRGYQGIRNKSWQEGHC